MLLASATLCRWLRDKKGVAAIETALIAPVAVGLLGLVAIWAQAIAIQRKVTLTATTITDLVSQQGTQSNTACSMPAPYNNPSTYASVNQSTVDNLLNNAANVLYPYVKPTSGTNPVTGTNISDMTMVVSEISVSGTTGTVVWSEPMPSHGTALKTAAAVTLPELVASTGNLIMGTVTYAYTPPVIGEAVGTITLQDTIYLNLRQWSCMALNVGS